MGHSASSGRSALSRVVVPAQSPPLSGHACGAEGGTPRGEYIFTQVGREQVEQPELKQKETPHFRISKALCARPGDTGLVYHTTDSVLNWYAGNVAQSLIVRMKL